MKQFELKVEGMSCQHCVRAVDDALRSVDGVEVDEVAIGRASVRLADGVTVSTVIDALNDVGYTAEVGAVS